MGKEKGESRLGLQDTSQQLKELLHTLAYDLAKATRGNKAAAQRVRTGTIRLEKIGKKYRKESVRDEKKQSRISTLVKPIGKKSSRKKLRSYR